MVKLAIRPLVLIFIVSAFFYVLIEQSIMSWLPTFNSQVLHLSTTLSIQMASILAASTALGTIYCRYCFKKNSLAKSGDWLPCNCGYSGFAGYSVGIEIHVGSIDNWLDAPFVAYMFPIDRIAAGTHLSCDQFCDLKFFAAKATCSYEWPDCYFFRNRRHNGIYHHRPYFRGLWRPDRFLFFINSDRHSYYQPYLF